MQHERRSGQRHAVLLSVELSHAGEERMKYRAHNVAPEGMLLENRSCLLKIGSRVDLKVAWKERSWSIAATVTHCNSNCMGVMFNQRQSEFYRTVTQPRDRLIESSHHERHSLTHGAS